MKPKRVYLVAKEDTCTGDVGLVIKDSWAHKYDGYEIPTTASRGDVIAHDLLEHPNGKVLGTIENEMEALGGALYVRGNRNFGMYAVEQSLAFDMVRMYREWADGMAELDIAKASAKAPDCPAWARIEDVLSETYYDLKKQSAGEGYQHPFSFKTYALCIRYHMAKGWNAAEKRFQDEWQAGVLFDSIAQSINKTVQFNALEEGQRWMLTFDDAKAECRHLEWWG